MVTHTPASALAHEDAFGIFIPAYASDVARGFHRETIERTHTADELAVARAAVARRTLSERLAHIRRLAGEY
jgi:chloramphenicol 3-O-phosphotransferase